MITATHADSVVNQRHVLNTPPETGFKVCKIVKLDITLNCNPAFPINVFGRALFMRETNPYSIYYHWKERTTPLSASMQARYRFCFTDALSDLLHVPT